MPRLLPVAGGMLRLFPVAGGMLRLLDVGGMLRLLDAGGMRPLLVAGGMRLLQLQEECDISSCRRNATSPAAGGMRLLLFCLDGEPRLDLDNKWRKLWSGKVSDILDHKLLVRSFERAAKERLGGGDTKRNLKPLRMQPQPPPLACTYPVRKGWLQKGSDLSITSGQDVSKKYIQSAE